MRVENGWNLGASEFFQALQTTSILHVLVLVYLRLLSIRKPLYQESRVIRLRKILITFIWVASFTVQILGIMADYCISSKWHDSYQYVNLANFIFVMAIPFIFIIIMSCLLVRTLNMKKHDAQNPNSIIATKSAAISNYDKSNKIVRRLVCFLLFSLTPHLIVKIAIHTGYVLCSYFNCDLGQRKVVTFTK